MKRAFQGCCRLGEARRNVLIVLGAIAVAPRAVLARSKQPVLIGFLSLRARESDPHALAAFKEGLVALGWKEGSQFSIEERWADGREDRLPSLARELAAKKPAIIVASGMLAVVNAAKTAPKIPIVMTSGTNPVAVGVAASLGRPGGMVTGVAGFQVDLTGKLLELLLTAAPKVRRIGCLVYSHSPAKAKIIETAHGAAAQFNVEMRLAEVASPEEIEPAIGRLAKDGAQALLVATGALFGSERLRIVKLALAQRWPVVGSTSEWAKDGALLSYGADRFAYHRRAAYYVDRILKGAKPGEIPIKQPTKFELVINMKTARALGLDIPRDLAVRADRVIE